MCTLAHVFEAAGLATVVLASMREVAERMAVPRALYCEFPLGRPLGRPDDPALQHQVIRRALSLLDSAEPLLDTYPEVIESEETPLACSLPPRFDPALPPAVDEARGLRAAYDRALAARGITSVGRAIDADTVTDALDVLHSWAEGQPWQEHPLPGKNTIAVCHDIRSYYREAALELATGPAPGGRSFDSWFYSRTEAGKTMLAARSALKAQEAPFPFWFYMVSADR